MSSLHDVLQERENRSRCQQHLLQVYHLPLVCATMNIAGSEKNSFLIQRCFDLALQDLYANVGYAVLEEVAQSRRPFGPEAYFIVKNAASAEEIKRLLIGFEQTHPIGRLLDLDVLRVDGSPVHREALGLPLRSCFLCEKEAKLCARSRSHGLDELVEYTQKVLSSYLEAKN